MSETPEWLILVGAVVGGYFVVSKIIDYFKKGSAWESPPKAPDEYSGNWPDEDDR